MCSSDLAFGYTSSPMVNDGIHGYVQMPLDLPGQPAPPAGTYYVRSTLQSVTEFVIPCPNGWPPYWPPGAAIDGYNPVYAQAGANSSLTWSGPTATTLYSTYQVCPPVLGRKVFLSWVDNPYPFHTTSGIIGTVSSINYDSGAQTFTVNMVTATPMSPLVYTVSSVYFLSVNT